MYIRTYEIFGNLLEFLYKAFPSTNTQLSTSILETLEVLADEDYYENVVIESDNKKKYFTYLSKEFQSKVILLLDQSCKNLGKDVNDQKYKYIVKK